MVDDSADTPGVEGTAGVVEKPSRVSIVWIIPLAAALLGGWLLYRSIADAGASITLTFETASDLEAGKTAIKFKDVQIGLVDTIEVSEDSTHVVVGATIHPSAEHYLRETTTFWVVRPQITTEGISGLGTLLSGAYITLNPGSGAETRSFKGLETAPVVDIDTPGTRYVLHAGDLGSVGVDSPIYHRGIRVGEVLSYRLDPENDQVTIEIFVAEPYDELVWQDTRFWNASGIDVTIDAKGMNVQTASLTSLLIGGVAFDTLSPVAARTAAEAGRAFQLFRNRSDIDPSFARTWDYVVYFRESVRGLSQGAPVELLGLQVGEVSRIGFEFGTGSEAFRIPVTLAIQPERLQAYGGVDVARAENQEQAEERMRDLIAAGLRAQLETASLLTGQLFVELLMEPDVPATYARGDSPLFQIPSVTSDGLAKIEDSVNEVLGKIAALPLEQLISNAAAAAESIDSLASSPELADAIRNGNTTLEGFDQLAKDASVQLERVGGSVERTLSPTSSVGAGLSGALAELGRAMRSIRVLAAYLERHPEAILQGKPGGR